MRHRRSGIKIGRTTSHRQAMFRNMVTSLFKYDRIQTTDTKAKELRRWADHVITLAKKGDLHARRQVLSIMREKSVVHKLFEEAEERFGKMNGGYTRIIKIGTRPGDAASVSLIELVAYEEIAKKGKKKPKAKPKAKVETQAPKASTPADEVESKPSEETPQEEASAEPEAVEAAPEAEEVKAQEDKEAVAGEVEASPESAEADEPTAEQDAPDQAEEETSKKQEE